MVLRRAHPPTLIGLALALLGGATYLWLVQQKGDGRFEPALWFAGLVALGAAEVGWGAMLTGRARAVTVASGGALLVVTAGLCPLAMQTSHTAALLGSVGLLVAAGGVTAILCARATSRGFVATVIAAVVVVAVALPTAWSLASRGEGVGGESSAG